ncbi:MAG: hypothetical protein IPG07_04020 [Crocinitomicaceae bacterium]|nr:hypothetical protein [Crocinitomicaceae bacterium]MBK6951009.1 hypothetical protein [Crocinitomicaceae bacterium]
MTKFTAALFFILLMLSSCSSEPECQNSDINSFDSFLGITGETKEIELTKILGESTGGYYTDDNKSFIYTYHALIDAPIAVAVNANTTKVETVLMEILSLGEDFEKDLEKAAKKYNLDLCDSRFFGMKKDEIIAEMGEPDAEDNSATGVYSITYNSDNQKTSVNFKFFDEQDKMCSSVIVNWF